MREEIGGAFEHWALGFLPVAFDGFTEDGRGESEDRVLPGIALDFGFEIGDFLTDLGGVGLAVHTLELLIQACGLLQTGGELAIVFGHLLGDLLQVLVEVVGIGGLHREEELGEWGRSCQSSELSIAGVPIFLQFVATRGVCFHGGKVVGVGQAASRQRASIVRWLTATSAGGFKFVFARRSCVRRSSRRVVAWRAS